MPFPFPGRPRGRTATLCAALLIGAAALWATWSAFVAPPPTEMQVQAGDDLLAGGDYRRAAAAFDQALAIDPDDRAALMGKARALAHLGDLEGAEQVLDRVILLLNSSPHAEDTALRGQLAAAYGRRGQLNDLLARYDRALSDYVRSLTLDAAAAETAGFKELQAGRTVTLSAIRDRVEFLYKQLQLPEDQRVLVQPAVEQAEAPHRP